MVYGIRIQKDSVYGIWYKGFRRIQYMVNRIRIQKYSVYGIWYKDSGGFSIWYMVSGFRRIQYGIRIQKDSVYCI